MNDFRHTARKRFGQNFLTDRNIVDKIVAHIAPRPGDTMAEIGPGLGALTRPLLEKLGKLHAVELDYDLIPKLQELCAGAGELIVHQADALEFDFAQLAGGPRSLRVVGNLPYNISTPLLFHLIRHAEHIKDMHFMLQKEVVDRLAAPPGDPDYGRLSVMMQYHCAVEPLFIVAPTAFAPQPKVHSRIVRLLPHTTSPHPVENPGDFAALVKQAFAQRRKTLRNTLKPMLDEKSIVAAGIDPGARAETLNLAQFVQLTNIWGARKRTAS
jgi:16S rRNA (adenine1518-N6/adenine1519-N6)-dimethyltransferase